MVKPEVSVEGGDHKERRCREGIHCCSFCKYFTQTACVCVCVSMRVDRDFLDAAKLVENDTAFFSEAN